MPQAPLKVAIGGFDGLEESGPGPSVARALRAGLARPLTIVAAGADGLLAGAWLPGVADTLRTVPDARADGEGFAEAILRLGRDDGVKAYLPGCTAEVQALVRRSRALAEAGLACPLPSAEAARRMTRRAQVQFLHEHGFAVPFSQHVHELSEVRLVADQIGYPVVVLGMISGAALAYDGRQAEAAARKLGAEEGVILRRAISGDGFNVALVADGAGRTRGLVTIRRLLADQLGRPSSAAVVDDAAVRDVAISLQKCLDWRGPLEADLVRPTGSEWLFVTDIRPTLPSWSMLTHWAGCNLPAIALSEAMGRNRSGRAKPGILFVRGVDETGIRVENFQRLRQGVGMATPNGVAALRPRANGGGIKVAVTGMGTFEVVNPGLGAARALRDAPGISAVYGFGYGTLESGVYQPNLFDACFRLPPTVSTEALLERVTEAHSEYPFDVLIPCMDQELPRFMKIQPQLRELGIATLMPTKRALESRSKIALFSGKLRADWGGFRIPESRIVRTEAEALRAAAAIGLPCAVKGPLALCIPAHTMNQVRSAWARLRGEGADRVIVQQFLDGEIFATAAVCDRRHRTLARTTIKKAAICARGSTWSAVHVPNPALEESFAAFLAEIGWTGPVEGEFIRDRLTDRFYLFEVNPRFTAWISFTAALGSNHPLITALAALDREVPTVADDASVMFMRSGIEVCIKPAGLAAFSTRGALIHA